MEVSTHLHTTCRPPLPEKGCSTVLVLDGNQKNNRPVCAAEDAGFVEYTGLPGKVKTGCMDTPEQKSCFCSLHKPRQVNVSHTDTTTQHESRHGVIEMILTKKTLRDVTLYEVSKYRHIHVDWSS